MGILSDSAVRPSLSHSLAVIRHGLLASELLCLPGPALECPAPANRAPLTNLQPLPRGRQIHSLRKWQSLRTQVQQSGEN
jgi:hypothetical protein